MKKIRAIIEKEEESFFVLKSNGLEFALPKEFVSGEAGDLVCITFASDAEDQKTSNEIAKELLKIAFREK